MIIDEITQAARAAIHEMTGADAAGLVLEFPEDPTFGDFTVN